MAVMGSASVRALTETMIMFPVTSVWYSSIPRSRIA